MQLQPLTHHLFMLRRLVAEAEPTDPILYQLNAFEHHLTQHLKHHYALQDSLAEAQGELKKLKKQARGLGTRLQARDQQCQQLKDQMERLRDINSCKVRRLTRELNECRTKGREVEPREGAETGRTCGVQCELIEGQLVKELQAERQVLLKRYEHIQGRLAEEHHQNKAKQLYIDSLLASIAHQQESELESEEVEESKTSEASLDNSTTIDAVSELQEDGSECCEECEWAEMEQAQVQCLEDVQKADLWTKLKFVSRKIGSLIFKE